MVLVPGLPAAMVLRGGDITLKYSVDKTSRELLFLPIPLALKKRTKVFIDMFVDRWARGLAGGMLLLLTMVLEFGSAADRHGDPGLLAGWMILALMMRREYVDSFRRALARREIDLAGLDRQHRGRLGGQGPGGRPGQRQPAGDRLCPGHVAGCPVLPAGRTRFGPCWTIRRAKCAARALESCA